MNVCMVRIDERLIHGQILLKWIQYFQCDQILVVDNETASDPIMSSLLRLSLPAGVSMNICSLNQGIHEILNGADTRSVMVLVKELQTVKELWSGGVPLKHVNLSRIPFGPGRRRLTNGIYTNKEEEKLLRILTDAGINIIVQMVPESTQVMVKDLLNPEERL